MLKKNNPITTPYPDHVIEAVARCLLPDIIAAFNSEEGQKMYAEWKYQQPDAVEKGNDNSAA